MWKKRGAYSDFSFTEIVGHLPILKHAFYFKILAKLLFRWFPIGGIL
jgi:hypothetical protein